MRNDTFELALNHHGITKKEFAERTHMPYNTVAGWKKNGIVPEYAGVLLKSIAATKQRKPHPNKIPTHTPNTRRIQAVFWGKNIDVTDALRRAKAGEAEYLKPILTNLFYKDAVRALGVRTIVKLKPRYGELLDKEGVELWANLAETYERRYAL